MLIMTLVVEAVILAFLAGNLGRLFNDWSKKARVKSDMELTANVVMHNTHYRGGCTILRVLNGSNLYVAFTADPVELANNGSLAPERFGKIDYAEAPPKFPCHAPKDPAVDIFILRNPNKYAADIPWHTTPEVISKHRWYKRLAFNLILVAIGLYVIRVAIVGAMWFTGYPRKIRPPPPPHHPPPTSHLHPPTDLTT